MATKAYQSKTNRDDPALQKGNQPNEQNKPDSKRVPTVTPGDENGNPGAPAEMDSSNKGKGPSGENL